MRRLQQLSAGGHDVPDAHCHCLTHDISDASEFAYSHPGGLSGAIVVPGERSPLAPRSQHRV
jgi:hypothetical protein